MKMNGIMEVARMDEDTALKAAAPEGVGGSIPSASATKFYKCECGKEFDHYQKFNGHKTHCKIHRELLGKPILPSNFLGKKFKRTILKETNPEKWELVKQKISNSLKGKSTHSQSLETRQKISNACKQNKKSGGYRKGSGRGKKGWYKGFFCDSQYELGYVIYCLDHGIKIERNKKGYEYIYNNEKHIYLPDFIVNGELVEIKGFYREIDNIKLAAVLDKKITILYTKDLKFVSDYLQEKYGLDIDHVFIMYENRS